MVVALGRKERENYIPDPDVVSKAIANALQEPVNKGAPTENQDLPERVKQELQQIFETPEIRETVECQVCPRYRKALPDKHDPSTKEKETNEWFASNWENFLWKQNNCSGKKVLKRLREWSQREFGVALTDTRLIKALGNPPEDVCALLKRVCAHLKG